MDTSPARQIGRSFSLARDIYRNEGGLRGVYRGLTPNLLGNASSWALYFHCYDVLKTSIQSSFHADGSQLQASDYLAASATAGVSSFNREKCPR